jgi:hypothetical protein
LRYRKLWFSIGFGLVGLVIYLSLTPRPIDVGQVGEVSFGHFLAYLTLMLWFAQLSRGWRAGLSIAAALVLMGVGLEYLQGLTSYRSFDPLDMRDNAVGVALGLAIGRTRLGHTLEWVERRIARE